MTRLPRGLHPRARFGLLTDEQGRDRPTTQHHHPRRPRGARRAALATTAAAALALGLAVPASAEPQTPVADATIDGFPSAPQGSSASTDGFDWAQRARDYDAYVYDWTDRGAYTTISADTTALNMADGSVTYKLPAYYGDTRVQGTAGDGNQEAVNEIASVVGASLVGIDKSDQDGYDYVDMLQTFYHDDLGVAKNTPSSSSTSPGSQSIWYTTVANVLYYMVGDLYPDATDMSTMLRSIADQYYEMLATLGGADADITLQDYDFGTETAIFGRDEGGEAAAGAAAILVWAHAEFGDAKYLEGAEWAMDALERSSSNLYYEVVPILAPYIAARMNAEYGTEYDVSTYLDWLLSGSDSRTGWGTITATWGGVDVSGLMGSRTDSGPVAVTQGSTTGYAFAMNSFATPLMAATAKYDSRYADLIGRWMLNVDSAARSFYADQLDADQQYYGDRYIEDPAHVIAYEGLTSGGSAGIMALGDVPVRSTGWGVGSDATGLGLYGSSWVGFMGAALSGTNVENVVRTDLNALDFFGDNAYPTSLYYNPNATDAQVTVDLGSGAKDLYDSVSDSMLATGVSGSTTITVPAGHSVVLVEVTAGATRAVSGNATTFDGQAVAWNTNDDRDPAMKGSSVVASSSADGSEASATIDGDDSTAWTSASAGEQSLTLTLAASKTISSVDVTWGTQAARSFTVETSTDGVAWTVQQAVTDGSGGRSSVSFPPTTARYVRVTLTEPVVDGASAYAVRTLSANQAQGDEDLARGAVTTASSTQGNKSDVAPVNATDGDSGTRWESATSDPQWIQVDLGASTDLGRVVISWETAAAKDYTIDVSDDGITWTTAATVRNTVSPTTTVTDLPAGTSGRYVRMSGTTRLTTYAYSLFSFEVYAAASATTVNPDGSTATRPATASVPASGPLTAGAAVDVVGGAFSPDADVEVTWTPTVATSSRLTTTGAAVTRTAVSTSSVVTTAAVSARTVAAATTARTDGAGAVTVATTAPSAGTYTVRLTDGYGVTAVSGTVTVAAATDPADPGTGSGSTTDPGSGTGSTAGTGSTGSGSAGAGTSQSEVSAATAGTTVTSTGQSLAVTGVDVLRLLLVACGALALGVGAVAWRRRRA